MTYAVSNNTMNDDILIADEQELREFTLNDSNAPIPPSIRGVIAETALTGVIRYPWPLLRPVIHRLLHSALHSFPPTDLAENEAGPPKPMPNGTSIDQATSELHALLDDFSQAPFTYQRLCELVLEPRKQYTTIDKYVSAIERLLLVTSTLRTTENPPPRPSLAALGPVNENHPSPYDGEPPAGPPPTVDAADNPLPPHIGNGGLLDCSVDEYAIFMATDDDGPRVVQISEQHTAVVGTAPNRSSNMNGLGAGSVAIGSPIENKPLAPMKPSELIQAEAFVQAALGSPPWQPPNKEQNKNDRLDINIDNSMQIDLGPEKLMIEGMDDYKTAIDISGGVGGSHEALHAVDTMTMTLNSLIPDSTLTPIANVDREEEMRKFEITMQPSVGMTNEMQPGGTLVVNSNNNNNNNNNLRFWNGGHGEDR